MDDEILKQCLHSRPQHTENILRLFNCSPFFVSLMQGSNEEECFHLFVPKERCLLPHQRKDCIPKIDSDMSLQQTMTAMRQCKKRGLRHTLWWELGVGGSVLRSACSLSLWADHFLQTAMIKAEHILQPRFGHIEDGRFCVIGLGHLGGLELSLNASLQLLFIWDASSSHSSGPQAITTQDYYAQLTQLVIQMVSENTKDGLVWPIKMHLRPDGEDGPICMNLTSTLRYYHNDGQTWERAMLTKARSVAGNLDLGDSFIEKTQSFVYRNYMDYMTVQSLAEMKKKIDNTTSSVDIKVGFNIQYGQGGIREIEFKIQALQLLHANRYPQLQLTNSMDTLTFLQKTGLLPETEAQELHRSYVIWRMVEHALQARLGETTHVLAAGYESYLLQSRRLECPTQIMQKHAKMAHLYFSEQFTSVVHHETPTDYDSK